MENGKNNIFTNDEWFAAFAAVMTVTGLWEAVLCFTTRSVTFIMVPFVAVLGLILFLSYKKHEKNVMKGLMGAVLMWMLCEEVSFAGEVIVNSKTAFCESLGKAYTFFSILKFFNVLLILLIFVLHFRINYAHRSRPVEIRVNQLLNFALIAFYAVDILTQLLFGDITVSQIVLMVFKTVLMFMVISIESRLDEFRLQKEAKGA